MDIKAILSKDLGINTLTRNSLLAAIEHHDLNLSDSEKRQVNIDIAHYVIQRSADKVSLPDIGKPSLLPDTRVLGINHAGPLDITIEWNTTPDGGLKIKDCRHDAGGDQVNVSKVFSHFEKNIALIALAGPLEEMITKEWEADFLNERIIPDLIRTSPGDKHVEVLNIVDGEPLPVMHGWADALSPKTIDEINQKTLSTLNAMFQHDPDNIWMILSAGGPIRYDERSACYASLVNTVKSKYGHKVEMLIDFCHMSSPDEAMSVVHIPREIPQDIIKPNLEEFVQILTASGLAETDTLNKSPMTENDIKTYAMKVRAKYNLLGILLSMDKNGLMLVLEDRIIREKGVNITQICHTAAGDSLKAGFIYALIEGRSFEEAVHTGNLFGAGTASLAGTQTVTPEVFAEMEVLAREQNVSPEVEYLK